MDRRRVIVALALPSCAALVVSGPGIAAVIAHYLGLSLREYLQVVVLVEVVGSIMLGFAFARQRHAIRAIFAWADRRSPQIEAQAREAAFALPGRLLRSTLLVSTLVAVPVFTVALTRWSGYSSTVDTIEIVVGGVWSIALASGGTFYFVEVLLQPLRSSFALERLGTVHRVRLSRRLLGATTLAVVYGGSGVGIFATDRATAGEGHLLTVIGLSLVIALLIGVILGPVLASVLRPIRDLQRGALAIGSGRLDARTPVTTGDELGELAESFNQMADDVRASRARIVRAADEERRRMERDLHDGAQQHLVLLRLRLGLAQKALAEDPAAAPGALGQARDDLDRALAALRELARGIYPAALVDGGLETALAQAVARAALPATLESTGIGRHPADLEAAVYFCCMEALQNASKHAGRDASATVRLRQDATLLHFEVTDTGCGIRGVPGAGLQNMADRVGALGGRLAIEATSGVGTAVTGSVPLAALPPGPRSASAGEAHNMAPHT